MRLRQAPTAPPMVKINVTPIIDVALVLVIILLVTAPMMSMSDLPVDLPRPRDDEMRYSPEFARAKATLHEHLKI